MEENKMDSKICCEKFDPAPWDNKELSWKEKLFLEDKVFTLFYMPLNFGAVVTRNMKKIMSAEAMPKKYFALADCCSPWKTKLFIEVTKEVPNSEMVKFSGKFLSKVFEGSFKETGKFAQEMKSYVSSKKKEMDKMYFFYTTCPKCAKKYGKNYIVILAKVK